MATITALNIYPVKSLHGISLSTARLGVRGFDYDREWLVVDSHFKFVTQRKIPLMATINVSLSAHYLRLAHPSLKPLDIALDDHSGSRVRVQIWKDRCDAIDQGDVASQWLTKVLGESNDEPLRLVRFPPDEVRPVDAKYLAGDESNVGFADAYPYLITVEESLNALNDKLKAVASPPVPMNRFRSNIVIRGLQALAEHHTEELTMHHQKVRLALRKPCQRCKVTTIDQLTGAVSPHQEPLRTLVQSSPFKHLQGGFFGQNAILLAGAGEMLSVGDQLAPARAGGHSI